VLLELLAKLTEQRAHSVNEAVLVGGS